MEAMSLRKDAEDLYLQRCVVYPKVRKVVKEETNEQYESEFRTQGLTKIRRTR